MINKLIPTTNTKEADKVLDGLKNKKGEGMVLLFGETGFGKSFYGLQKTFSAGWGYYRLHASDTARSFVQEIYVRMNKVINGSTELIRGNTPKIEKACIELFRQNSDYVLVIDEVNLAIQFRKWEIIEIIRDFKDEGGATIVMIGEHDTQEGLKGYNQHFFSRCEFVEFKANTNEDIAGIIKNTTKIKFDAPIYAKIIKKAKGNLCIADAMIREFEQISIRKGKNTLGLDNKGNLI